MRRLLAGSILPIDLPNVNGAFRARNLQLTQFPRETYNEHKLALYELATDKMRE